MRRLGLSILMTLSVTAVGAQQRTTDWALIDSLAAQLVEQEYVPGLAVIVVGRDGELHRVTAGWADLDSRREVDTNTAFYIASSTKSFTALATATLASRGIWRLDQVIGTLLPGTEFHADVDPGSITIEELLSHTHGIASDGPLGLRAAYTGEIDRAEMLDIIRLNSLARGGKEFDYSNLGYNILSLAMDSIVGPWQDVIREEVLTPLGMYSSTARVSDVPPTVLAMPHGREPTGLVRYPMDKTDASMHAAGGMFATIGDLGRWVRLQLGEGSIDGREVFPRSMIRDVHRPRAEVEAQFFATQRVGYGLGWYTGILDGETLVHHHGGFAGYSAHISFQPERGIGVVVLVNGGLGLDAQEMLARMAYSIGSGDPDRMAVAQMDVDSSFAAMAQRLESITADRARRAARPQTLPLQLDQYVGEYRFEPFGTIRIVRWNDRLRLAMGNVRSSIEGFDVANHRVRFEAARGSGSVGTFEVVEGRVTAFTILGMRFDRVPR